VILKQPTWALLVAMLCTFSTHAAAQQATLSATSLTFGAQIVGSVSGPRTVTVTNTGRADLTVSSIAASGGFSQTNHCSTLHPGQSCSITVSYISDIVGAAKGVLTINDNAPSSPHLVNLSGTAVAPVALTPGSLNFGSVAVGASATKSITLTSNGSSFGIRAISASGDFAQTNNCPTALSGGQSCTINLTFRPRASGARAGVLAVARMDSGFTNPLSGFTAALSGTGTGVSTASGISLQPAALNFGARNPFDTSQHSQTVKLTNTSSNTSLTVQSVSALGPIYNGTAFYQIASTNCVGMLAPGAECTIQVVQNPPLSAFAPQSAPGSVVIVDSSSSSPAVVPLSSSILPEAQFTPASLTFPAQRVGTTSAAQIVVVSSNLDRDGLSLIPMTVSGDFNVVSAGAHPCGLSPSFVPGVSCTLGVTFTPHQTGTISGAVTLTAYPECNPQPVLINHQACPNAQVINLTGTGQ